MNDEDKISNIKMVCDDEEYVKLGYGDKAFTTKEKLERIREILDS